MWWNIYTNGWFFFGFFFDVWRWNWWFPVWEGSHGISSSSLVLSDCILSHLTQRHVLFCNLKFMETTRFNLFIHRFLLIIHVIAGEHIFFYTNFLTWKLVHFIFSTGMCWTEGKNRFNTIQSCTTNTSCCNNDHTFCVCHITQACHVSVFYTPCCKHRAVITFLSWDIVWFPVWRCQHRVWLLVLFLVVWTQIWSFYGGMFIKQLFSGRSRRPHHTLW